MEKAVLEARGYEVIATSTLMEFEKTLQAWRPDLILTDIHMPEAKGTDICRTLKNEYGTQDIPIILFSSLPDDELAQLAEQVGADGSSVQGQWPGGDGREDRRAGRRASSGDAVRRLLPARSCCVAPRRLRAQGGRPARDARVRGRPPARLRAPSCSCPRTCMATWARAAAARTCAAALPARRPRCARRARARLPVLYVDGGDALFGSRQPRRRSRCPRRSARRGRSPRP